MKISSRFCVVIYVSLLLFLSLPLVAFEITSQAFTNGEPIPQEHTCSGENISPELSWKNPPNGTKTYVLICDDPDAPVGNWVHWVVYNIPQEATRLPQKTPSSQRLSDGTLQGINDFRKVGYDGPCPPPGSPHRYFFRLYALDTELAIGPGYSKSDLLDVIKDHLLEKAELVGTFSR
ncbi:YbhB/YbcL family Raf kinase inhibitor-like protein [Chlamydiota bacterium]